jgi:glycosyltransferase involved in cell wall biosynthesis
LRILHLTAGSDAGGLSRYVHDLSVAMMARGHTITVGGERGAWHRLFEQAAIPWIDVPLKGGPLALRATARTLGAWLKDNPVDLIHTHYRRPTLVGRRLQRGRCPPILYTVHLSDMKLSWPWGLFSDFGDHTHVASIEARRWVIEDGGVPEDRVTLIPHGIDPERFPPADDAARRAARTALGIPPGARVATYVGRLDYPKNEHWLLDVAARVPHLHLLIAGEGPNEPALRARLDASSLRERVHLLGHRDPLPVYQASDAFLLPSLREGFSLVCSEALAVGVPVLRTRTAGTEELIIEDVTGRSVEIDHDRFVAAAVEFLSLPIERLRAMGAAGAEHVRKNFTFNRQFDQTLALYARVATLR